MCVVLWSLEFKNAEDEVHMLSIQLFGRGGRHFVAEVEVEWINDGDPNIFYHINEQIYALNEHINVSTSSSSDYCTSSDSHMCQVQMYLKRVVSKGRNLPLHLGNGLS